jgi:hypothetical protein
VLRKATLPIVLGLWFTQGTALFAGQCGHCHCGHDLEGYRDECTKAPRHRPSAAANRHCPN